MTRIEDKLRGFDDMTEEVVEVPEWAEAGIDKLIVRSMDGTTRARMLQAAVDPETGSTDFEKLYPEIIIATCYDPEAPTELAFSDPAFVNSRNAKATERLAMAGMAQSGLNEKASDKAAERFPDGGN